MKRVTTFLSAVLMICLLVISAGSPMPVHASAVFSHGEGTEESPYKISNCDQLQAIANDLDAHYELIVNIDCDANDFGYIGNDDTPFTGYLEGNNHIIMNLHIDDHGLFGVISVGTIQNLKLVNTSVSGSADVGSLAGLVLGAGTNITNVHSVNATIGGSSNYIGGMVGRMGNGNPVLEKSSFEGSVSGPGVTGGFVGSAGGAAYIYNNYVKATITVGPNDSPSVGGFFGDMSTNQTGNNYAITTIDAVDSGFTSTVGGFSGTTSGWIQTSFADMNYNSGASQVGDFIGFSAGSTINTNYYADHGHGCASNSANPGAAGCQSVDTTANPSYFKDSSHSPMTYWDFENVWEQVGGDYPRLRNEANFSEASNDINGDSINDSYQANVIGVPDAEDNLTVVELNSDSDCTLDPTGSWIDSGYYKADPDYPLQIPKMTAFTVYCPNPGSQVQVTLVYPEQYDVSKSVVRFYDNVANQYHNVSGVEFGTREVSGNTVTTATYMLVDGGVNDTDGAQDGAIHDPVGIAVNNTPVVSVSGSTNQTNATLADTGQEQVLQTAFASLLVIMSITGLLYTLYVRRFQSE